MNKLLDLIKPIDADRTAINLPECSASAELRARVAEAGRPWARKASVLVCGLSTRGLAEDRTRTGNSAARKGATR